MAKTNIEWTSFSWNFWAGCELVSPGCTNCYAMSVAYRFRDQHPTYKGLAKLVNGHPVWTGELALGTERTRKMPMRLSTPTLIFVNSMSDWLHPRAPDAWRLEMLDIMRVANHHQYQVLTKRPELMQPFLERTGASLPPNFWAGVSVENAKVVGRIDILRRVPAKVRFLSVEPLIGPIGPVDLTGIHWVIVGWESGQGARPGSVAWDEEVLAQCLAQRVPFFYKQTADSHGHKISLPTLRGKQWTEMPAGFDAPTKKRGG